MILVENRAPALKFFYSFCFNSCSAGRLFKELFRCFNKWQAYLEKPDEEYNNKCYCEKNYDKNRKHVLILGIYINPKTTPTVHKSFINPLKFSTQN